MPGDMPLDEAERRFASSPDDFAAGLVLYVDADNSGKPDVEEQILARMASVPQSPDYVHWLLANLLARLNKPDEAWKAFAQLPR